MPRFYKSVPLLLLMLFISGCAVFQPINRISSDFWNSLRPNSGDYRDGDEATGEWDFVGREGRGDRPLEKSNDPLRRLMMSDKALEIEGNLGIGD